MDCIVLLNLLNRPLFWVLPTSWKFWVNLIKKVTKADVYCWSHVCVRKDSLILLPNTTWQVHITAEKSDLSTRASLGRLCQSHLQPQITEQINKQPISAPQVSVLFTKPEKHWPVMEGLGKWQRNCVIEQSPNIYTRQGSLFSLAFTKRLLTSFIV